MKTLGSYKKYNPATGQSDWLNTRSYAIIILHVLVVDQPSDSSTSNTREYLSNSVNISWNAPADAGICCVQYRVVSSDGITVNTTATSFTLYNITTREEGENAFILVRCMDQIGTIGPEVIYRPDIGMLFLSHGLNQFHYFRI